MKQYYTQMEAAKKGIITPEMEIVAAKEDMDVEQLRERVAQGVIAIPCNVRHTSISPEGIGMGLRTKSTSTSVFRATARITLSRCRR